MFPDTDDKSDSKYFNGPLKHLHIQLHVCSTGILFTLKVDLERITAVCKTIFSYFLVSF